LLLLLLFIFFISVFRIIYLKICSRVYNFVATLLLKYIIHELLLLLLLVVVVVVVLLVVVIVVVLVVVVVGSSSSSSSSSSIGGGGNSVTLLNFIHKPHDGWSQGKYQQLHSKKLQKNHFH